MNRTIKILSITRYACYIDGKYCKEVLTLNQANAFLAEGGL